MTLTMVHLQHDIVHCHPTSQVHSHPGPGRECVDGRMCSAVTIQSEAGWRRCVIVRRPRRLITGQFVWLYCWNEHYSDVMLGAMTSQITSVSVVCSTVCSSAYHSKQSSVTLAFERGIHRSPVDSPHKGSVTWKMFPFDDVIMITWHQ